VDKKRSIGVTLFSLLFIASSLATLLFGYIPTGSILYLLVYPGILIAGKTVGTILGLIFLLLGIFLFMLKEVARRIFIIIQAILLVAGVGYGFWSTAWVTGNAGAKIMAILVYPIVFNILPIIFIIFFTRPKVREQFK